MTQDALLEKQLEMLFSDAVLPKFIGPNERLSRSFALPVIENISPIPIAVPKPTRRIKPRTLTTRNALIPLLAMLAIVAVFAFSFVGRVGSAQREDSIALPPVKPNAGAFQAPPTPPQTTFATPKRTSTASTGARPVGEVQAFDTPTPQSGSVAITAPAFVAPHTRTPPGEVQARSAEQPTLISTRLRSSTPMAKVGANPTATSLQLAEPRSTFASNLSLTREPDPTATNYRTTTEPTAMFASIPSFAGDPFATTANARTPEPRPKFVPTPDPTTLAKGRSFPTRLVIPDINLEAPIVRVGLENLVIDDQPVSTWAVPAYFAAGWHYDSALPGRPGNTVLNGHQSIHGGVFRDLDALRADDEIILYAGETAYHYRVAHRKLLEEETQSLAVRIENARWIKPTGDDRLTLITCAPAGQSTHRLIVVAFPAGPDTSSMQP